MRALINPKYSFKDELGHELRGPARDRARWLARWKNNTEGRRQKNREYYLKHEDKMRARAKEYSTRPGVRERRINYNRRFYHEVDKARQNANPAKRNARIKAWKIKNPGAVKAMDHRRRATKKLCKVDSSAAAFIKRIHAMPMVSCYYCGDKIKGKDAHIDHVIALSKLGNHAAENLCASCPDCNLRKHARMPSQIDFQPQPLLDL